MICTAVPVFPCETLVDVTSFSYSALCPRGMSEHRVAISGRASFAFEGHGAVIVSASAACDQGSLVSDVRTPPKRQHVKIIRMQVRLGLSCIPLAACRALVCLALKN